MANMTQHRKALILRVVDGTATTSTQDRRSAFEGQGPAAARGLIEKVTRHAYKVIDEDIAAAKAAGLSEDAIFELVVSAAIGEADRQIESALAALDEATKA
jgi:alkylhydroperoxidase family enzyme